MRTRVELTDGRTLMGYLLRIETDELVLTDQAAVSEFGEPIVTRIPRVQIAVMEQGDHPAERGLATVGAVVIVLTAALLVVALSFDFSGM